MSGRSTRANSDSKDDKKDSAGELDITLSYNSKDRLLHAVVSGPTLADGGWCVMTSASDHFEVMDKGESVIIRFQNRKAVFVKSPDRDIVLELFTASKDIASKQPNALVKHGISIGRLPGSEVLVQYAAKGLYTATITFYLSMCDCDGKIIMKSDNSERMLEPINSTTKDLSAHLSKQLEIAAKK